jgi:hypothetical protein
MMRTLIIAATSAATLFSSAAFTQESRQGTASIPNFSGVWAHPSGPEPPASGPGPVLNRSRRNGKNDWYQYVGDYANPILKPEAAEVVKKHGEIELSGAAYALQATIVGRRGYPSFFFNLACRCCSSRTRSRSFTSGIMNSAT